MNTTLSTARSLHDHPPQPRYSAPAVPVRRVGLLDRIALHIGVALIKWGRRPVSIESSERRAHRIEQRIAQLERERVAARTMMLLLPPR